MKLEIGWGQSSSEYIKLIVFQLLSKWVVAVTVVKQQNPGELKIVEVIIRTRSVTDLTTRYDEDDELLDGVNKGMDIQVVDITSGENEGFSDESNNETIADDRK